MREYHYVCDFCGEEVIRATWKRPGHRFCDKCAVRRVFDTAWQLHDHKGPEYEKWKASMKRNIGRL